MRTTVTCILAAAALVTAGGCAPSEVLDNPPAWPAEWRGRKLYNTPKAYIYASNEAAAGEADRAIISVAQEFQAQTSTAATKGLIIVSDIRDKMAFADAKWLVMNMANRHAQAESQPAGSPEEIEKAWAEMEANAKEMGVDLKVMIFAQPLEISTSDLSGPLGLPAGVQSSVAWAAAIPTSRLVEQFISSMMDAAMKKQDLGLGEKIVMASMVALMKPNMVKAFAASRDVVLFGLFVGSQREWPKERKDREKHAYEERKQKEVGAMGGFPMPGQ